jgi:hypothetical protein
MNSKHTLAILRILWFTCAGSLLSATPLPPSPTIKLSSKAAQDFDLPSAYKLTVRPEGIVQLQHKKLNTWTFKPLSPGQAVISGLSTAGTLQWKRRVLVNRLPQKQPTLNRRSLKRAGKLCQQPEIKCSLNGRLIEGTTSSFKVRDAATLECRRGKCNNQIKLTPEARTKLIDYYQDLFGSHFQYEVDHNGHLTVFANILNPKECSSTETHLNHKSSFAVRKGLVSFICSSSSSTNNYRIESIIYLVTQNKDHSYGSEILQNLGQIISPNSLNELVSKLSNQQENEHLTIIGNPSTTLMAGQSSKIVSGGEFAQLVAHSDPNQKNQQVWKSYGLEILIQLKSVFAQRAQVHYDYTLKGSPQQRSSTRLSIHKIQSSATLPLDQPMILGNIQMQAENSESKDFLLFNDIPIIGPLFSAKQHHKSQNQLVVIARITELKTNNKSQAAAHIKGSKTIQSKAEEK